METKGEPSTLFVGMRIFQPLWKSLRILLKKLDLDLPCDPNLPLLGDCSPQGSKSTHYTLAQLCSLQRVHKAVLRNQPRCPSAEEGMLEMWCIYTLACFSAIRKKSCYLWGSEYTWRSSYKRLGQSQKDKHCMFLSFVIPRFCTVT